MQLSESKIFQLSESQPGQPDSPLIDLERLRTLGPAALDTTGSDVFLEIKLQELDIEFGGWPETANTLKGDDLFSAANMGEAPPQAIPDFGTLARAFLQVQFIDSEETVHVEMQTPSTLRSDDPIKAPVVIAWLRDHGFITAPAHHIR